MASALRPFAASMLALVLLGVLTPACTAQGEGERCEKAKTQNADCEPPLVCIPAERLLLNDDTDRCCPEISGEESDSRCARRVSTSGTAGTTSTGGGTGGTSSTGGTAGTTSTGGTDAAGGVPTGEGGMSGSPDLGQAGATSAMAGQGGTP